jgi:Histidine kinase
MSAIRSSGCSIPIDMRTKDGVIPISRRACSVSPECTVVVVTSEETRQHLQDAHQRVMALAAVQEHLHPSERHDQIEIGPCLTRLCESLAAR